MKGSNIPVGSITGKVIHMDSVSSSDFRKKELSPHDYDYQDLDMFYFRKIKEVGLNALESEDIETVKFCVRIMLDYLYNIEPVKE